MVFFNYSTMQMAAKVVYYGPGLCGKTTNLHYIYGHTTTDSRGEMVSLETETDRTLFFDLLPLDVGSIAGFNTRIQLYTVPGQVFYNTTRKLVLKGVDGVVFVADSQRAMLQANLDSFHNLEENLAEMGLSVETLPLVLQYNKRDLADIYAVEELNQALNRQGWPHVEASAVSGLGVFETLKGISKHTLLALKKRLGRTSAENAASPRLSPVGAPVGPAPHVTGPSAAPGQSIPSVAVAASASPGPASSPGVPGAAAVAERSHPVDHLRTSQPAPASAAATEGTPPAPPAPPAASTPAGTGERSGPLFRPPAKTATGKSRSVDVLSELEKLRREAMQPAANQPSRLAAADSRLQSLRSSVDTLASQAAAGAAKTAAGNGRAELSRSIEMTLKRADFVRARRFLVSFQVEDDQHRVVDAVRNLQIEIKDPAGQPGSTGSAAIEKLLLRLNIALHSKE